ncbi:MAG: hypothetical protein AABX70_04000 [Nanoarchaeota archaeon]
MKIKHLTVLNSREVKHICEQLEQQYGFNEKLPYAFLKSNKDKLYIVHRDIDHIDADDLKIDTLGLYFATQYPQELRLSMEGSQILNVQANKNVLELTKEQTKAWFRGEDLQVPPELTGFQILRCGSDYLGSGKAANGKLYNYLPKTRRIIPEHTPNEA